MFIDSDDYLDKDINFGLLTKHFATYPADIIKGQFWHTNTQNQYTLYPSVIKEVNKNNESHLLSFSYFFRNLVQDWFLQVGSYLIKREFILKHKLYFSEELSINEDAVFHINLFSLEGQIIETNYVFLHYTYHGENTTCRYNENRINSHIKTIDIILNYFKKNEKKEFEIELSRILFQHIYCLYRDYFLSSSKIKNKFSYITHSDFYSKYFNKFHMLYMIRRIQKYNKLEKNIIEELDSFENQLLD